MSWTVTASMPNRPIPIRLATLGVMAHLMSVRRRWSDHVAWSHQPRPVGSGPFNPWFAPDCGPRGALHASTGRRGERVAAMQGVPLAGLRRFVLIAVLTVGGGVAL